MSSAARLLYGGKVNGYFQYANFAPKKTLDEKLNEMNKIYCLIKITIIPIPQQVSILIVLCRF